MTSDGAEADGQSGGVSISDDGRYVTFHSIAANLAAGDTNGHDDIFVHDRQTDTTDRTSVAADGTEGNAGSGGGAISDHGRFVAYHTSASNIEVADTNRQLDVFVYDRSPDEPAVRFALSGLTFQPATARAGTPVHVSATVKSIGDLRGRYDAVLRVDGVVAGTATLEVKSGKVTTARFVLRGLAPGTHVATLGPLTAELTVMAR